MGRGLSFESFAAKIPDNKVNRETLYDWAKKNVEFANAKKRGMMLSMLLWEEMGQDLANGRLKGNIAAWIFNMKNRFKWTDSVEAEVSTDNKLSVISSDNSKKVELNG